MSTPKADCDRLLNALLPLAEKFLTEHGEFYPFGATLDAEGRQALAAADDGTERPPSQALIELIRNSHREGAKTQRLVAAALAYDVFVVPPGGASKTDAVAVELDHRGDYSVVVFVPYVISSGKVAFGEAFTNQGQHAIFSQERRQ